MKITPKMKDLARCETFCDYDFNVTTFEEKRSGTFVFLCPRCSDATWVDMNIDVGVRANTHSKNDEIKDIMPIRFKIKCSSCDHEFITQDNGIDPNMYSVIEPLMKYYPTEFSCEGHFNDSYYSNCSRPYLLFKDSKIRKYKPPRGWEYDRSTLFDTRAVIRYHGKFETLEDKKAAIWVLREWACKIVAKESKKKQRMARKESKKGR